MTKNSTRPSNGSTSDLKPPGWFSRRHPSREEHEQAVARYTASSGRDARVHNATVRANTWAEDRDPSNQIAALDARLGKGLGATRERARLAARTA